MTPRTDGTLLQCGHIAQGGPSVSFPERHRNQWRCPAGCGLQRRETSAKKRVAPPRPFGQR